MIDKAKITVADAAAKHHLNPSTLNSWVQQGKVESRLQAKGRRQIRLIDEESLLAHLAATGCNSDAEKKPEIDTSAEKNGPHIKGGPPPKKKEIPAKNLPSKSGRRENPEKKRHPNIPRKRAKDMMRSFSTDDLVDMLRWIAHRLETAHPRSEEKNCGR